MSSSLLEADVCDDVFWLEILPLLNLKDYMALASTSTTMRRRCLAESRPKLPIPVRDLYKLLAPVTDEEAAQVSSRSRQLFNHVQPRTNASVGWYVGSRCQLIRGWDIARQITRKMDTRQIELRIEWPNGRHGVRWDTT